MSNQNIRAIQARLSELGYDPGVLDGLDGKNTRAAIRAFQRDKGLNDDGIVGSLTRAALWPGSGSGSGSGPQRRGKRIAVFCDGTWNSPFINQPTHVHQLSEATVESNDQIKTYLSGLGTGGRLRTGFGKILNKIGGGAFGWGLDGKIREAYQFVAQNYEPGDEILIFGFSRGAYTARSLAGMIRKAGIVKDADDKKKVQAAFDLYRLAGRTNRPDSDHIWQQRRALSPRFATSAADRDKRADESHLVRISYLGVWDTVGALGIPEPIFGLFAKLWNTRFRFHDTVLSGLVRSARHAVAIDERREIFEAALWSNLETVGERPGLNGDKTGADRPYQQVWFVGDHGTVGGSGSNRGLAAITLDWIAEGARDAGLVLDARKMPGIAPNPVAPGSVLHKSGPGGGPKKWRVGPGSTQDLSPAAEARMKKFSAYRPRNLSRVLAGYFSGP
jgi:uncharacterized protein (DUF2235 family)